MFLLALNIALFDKESYVPWSFMFILLLSVDILVRYNGIGTILGIDIILITIIHNSSTTSKRMPNLGPSLCSCSTYFNFIFNNISTALK